MTTPETKTPQNNRFEQVDDRQDDAITLFLLKKPEGARGFMACPAAISQGRHAVDQVSTEAAARDAFRAAIHLANEIKAALVVVDPDAVWQSEWGILYREH